jgi:hypothetical protein
MTRAGCLIETSALVVVVEVHVDIVYLLVEDRGRSRRMVATRNPSGIFVNV